MGAQRLLIGYPNHIDRATLSGGSWEETLPLSNLVGRRLGPARTTNDDKASAIINVDMGSARAVGIFGVSYHNISTAGLIRLRGSANEDMSSPVHDSGWKAAYPVIYPTGVLPSWHPSYADRKLTTAEWTDGVREGFTHIVDPHVSARYWRIEIDDEANPYGYIQIERIWLGPAYESAASVGAEIGFLDESSRTNSGGSAAATFYATQRKRRRASFSLDMLEEGEAFSLPYELQRRAGATQQVYLVWDAADTVHLHRRSFVGVLSQIQMMRASGYIYHDVPMQVIEELYGPGVPPAIP